MRILVSNDDGVFAPGIKCLADALSRLGQVTVVAPDRNRSGASNSLTLENPLRVTHVSERTMSVDGTPTDCVHLAITGLLDEEPDIVVAGINAGANMGDDVLYSGTVAAATEGRFMGYPAIAVSLVGDNLVHYESAARAVICLVEQLKNDPLPADTILNVNVPNLPWDEIEGFEVTRLGQRHRSEPVVKDLDPRGREIFWVGPAGVEQDAGPGTDFNAVRTQHISVTPIHIDLTRYSAMDQVANWLLGIR